MIFLFRHLNPIKFIKIINIINTLDLSKYINSDGD